MLSSIVLLFSIVIRRRSAAEEHEIEKRVHKEAKQYRNEACMERRSFTDPYHAQKALIVDLQGTIELPCHHWYIQKALKAACIFYLYSHNLWSVS